MKVQVFRTILFCGWSVAAILGITALIAILADLTWGRPLWKVAMGINIAAILLEWSWWGIACIRNRKNIIKEENNDND